MIIPFQAVDPVIDISVLEMESDHVIEELSKESDTIIIEVSLRLRIDQAGIVAPVTVVAPVVATNHPVSAIGRDAVVNLPVLEEVFPTSSVRFIRYP